jgi:hypothetical protein
MANGGDNMNALIANDRTDKGESGYLSRYEKRFGLLQEREVRLLELGVREGGSLLMWEKYFPQGTICGIDLNPAPANIVSDRIVTKVGDQSDTGFLTRVASEVAPKGFDIIIDDASHIGALSKISFDHLFFHHLKSGGYYVIEDWGTGYWESFPDGSSFNKSTWADRIFRLLPSSSGSRRLRSHDFGMVGFIKQLIDLCAMDDITKPGLGIPGARSSAIDFIEISSGLVFVKKK